MTIPSNEHKPWHTLVEKALRAALDRHEPFTVEQVLNGVGLFSWTLDRAQAVVYANKLIAGTSAGNPTIERLNRKPYHSAVEQAVEMMTHRGESLSLDELLDRAAIFASSPNRKRARAYAKKLLRTDGGAA
jgi:hypothetical protein